MGSRYSSSLRPLNREVTDKCTLTYYISIRAHFEYKVELHFAIVVTSWMVLSCIMIHYNTMPQLLTTSLAFS